MVADGNYSTLKLLAHCISLPNPVTIVTRLRVNAALCDPPSSRQSGPLGRQPIKAVIEAEDTRWTRIVLPKWYSQQERPIEIVTATALWYHIGVKPVPIRWVVVRDPLEKFPPRPCCAPTLRWIRCRSCLGSCSAGR